MKTYFKTTLVIFIIFLCTGTLSAQLKFGAKGGLNISTQTTNFFIIESTNPKIGPNVGIFAEYELNDKFILQPELAYSSLGANWEQFGMTVLANLNYIVLPVVLKYRISDLSIGVGPQLGYLVSASYKGGGVNKNGKDDFKTNDFSALLNTDSAVNENIVIGLRYQTGLSNILPKDDIFKFTLKNTHSFQFSVGYKF